MKRRALLLRLPLFLLCVLAGALVAGQPLPAHAAPTLVLSPAAGNAPAVSGTLSGSGWTGTCRGGGVSGAGVSGSVAIGPGGTLSGTFTVSGAPGELVTVTVTASCSPSNLTARANFRFNDPTPIPRPTDTPTPRPTETPTPSPTRQPTATWTPTNTATATPSSTPTPAPTLTSTATRPGATSTPTPASGATATPTPAPLPTIPPPTPSASPEPVPAGNGRVRVAGCDPDPSAVLIRLDAVGGEAPPAGAESITPPVSRSGPGTYDFPLPGNAPNTLYAVRTTLNDPACPPAASGPSFALPGDFTNHLVVPAGKTELSLSSVGPTVPQGDYGQWVAFYARKVHLASYMQRVRVESTTPFDGVRWQVSLQPFGGESDPAADPPWLLAGGDVSCTPTCSFVIDFSTFMPQPLPPPTANWSDQSVGVLLDILNVLPGAQSKATKQTAPSGKVIVGGAQLSGAMIGSPVAGSVLTAPLDIYFRAIPLTGGTPAGPVSNTAVFRWLGPWDGPTPGQVKIVDCKLYPDDPVCPKPKPAPPVSYTVEIISYHGWIAPKDGHYGCFVVTKTVSVPIMPLGPNVTYTEGQPLCPPEPEEPDFFEALVDFVVDSVNWVANAYNTLKSEVINFVAQFVPAGLCDKTCLGTLLNASLMALGIPPEIPNFNQLADMGVDYLAEQAAAQVGIPKEIQELAGPAKDLAVAEFKKELKEKFKDGIEAGLDAMEKELSKQVAWIPDGVPIKVDPFSEYQAPTMALRVTRKPNSPECSPSKVKVYANVTNTTPNGVKELDGEYSAWFYDERAVPVPALAPGVSVDIPVILKPWLSWGYPAAKYYSHSDASKGWSRLYFGGTAHLVALGGNCVAGDSLNVAAEGAYP